MITFPIMTNFGKGMDNLFSISLKTCGPFTYVYWCMLEKGLRLTAHRHSRHARPHEARYRRRPADHRYSHWPLRL